MRACLSRPEMPLQGGRPGRLARRVSLPRLALRRGPDDLCNAEARANSQPAPGRQEGVRRQKSEREDNPDHNNFNGIVTNTLCS